MGKKNKKEAIAVTWDEGQIYVLYIYIYIHTHSNSVHVYIYIHSQEATVRTVHGTRDWFQSGKKYVKAVYCHPAYLTYMQSTS